MSVAQSTAIAGVLSLITSGNVMVLCGAGLSTESGIPDYRGPRGNVRRTTPMTYQEFTKNDASRQRYWARSHVGWRTIGTAQPNAGHFAITLLEQAGLLSGIVTQNVDGLQQSAGAQSVIELHGNLFTVVCLSCRQRTTRSELHDRLQRANPNWKSEPVETRPDGDALVSDVDVARFRTVACRRCGGLLKPDVVFFGESVPKERVQQCFSMLESSNALLVVGSSLTVMSGYRFILRAAELNLPIAIINQGATRGDGVANFRIDGPLGVLLPRLANLAAIS